MKVLFILTLEAKVYVKADSMIKEQSALTVSIDNQVDIFPLNNIDYYQVDEKDSIFIFGTNYIYRLKLKKADLQFNKQYLIFEDWISYVIHAGICLLNTAKSDLNLKIGISLKDYYQNYLDFSDIIASKKVKFLFNGSLKSKPIVIRQIDIYPNLFGQALSVSANYKVNDFVIINFSIDTLEGIFFEKSKPFLSQRYVLGAGFKDVVHLQDASSHFETDHLLEEVGTNPNIIYFDAFYDKFMRKKIEFICKPKTLRHIYYIENKEVTPSFHKYLKGKLGEYGDVHPIYDGSSIAANGLFSADTYRRINNTEDISMSVFPDHSTFVINREDVDKF